MILQCWSHNVALLNMLNIHGILKNILNFTGDSSLMEVPLIYLTQTHWLWTFAFHDIPSAFEIVRKNDKFNSFKNLTVLYNNQSFICLEHESFSGVLYVKLGTSICNHSDLSMLIVCKITQILHNLFSGLHT